MARWFLHKALFALFLLLAVPGCLASFATSSLVETVERKIKLHHVRRMGLFTFGIANGVLYSRSIEYSWKPEHDLTFAGIVVDNIHPQHATNELLIEGHVVTDGRAVTIRRSYVLMHDETEKNVASVNPPRSTAVASPVHRE